MKNAITSKGIFEVVASLTVIAAVVAISAANLFTGI